jgi:hypothetical protein
MTTNEFNALCGEHLIDPAIALENEQVVQALREGDDAKVETLVKEEF